MSLSFEALDFAEVKLRISKKMPKLTADEVLTLSRAVMALIPPPSELGEHLRNSLSGLEGIWEFVRGSAGANEDAAETLYELNNELFNLAGFLQTLRDRFDRRCKHEKIEPTANGGRYCPDCGSGWSPGQNTCEMLGELHTPRKYLPRERKERERPIGRAFFVFFITELLRKLGHDRTPALRISGQLLEMFWNDGMPSEKDDLQLDTAYKKGSKIGKAQRLGTIDHFLAVAPFLENFRGILIWVPKRPGPGK
jgi:hypothetical protein